MVSMAVSINFFARIESIGTNYPRNHNDIISIYTKSYNNERRPCILAFLVNLKSWFCGDIFIILVK